MTDRSHNFAERVSSDCITLFIDLRGFTATTASKPETEVGPNGVMRVVNNFYTVIGRVRRKMQVEDPQLLKPLGDALLMVWEGADPSKKKAVIGFAVECHKIVAKNVNKNCESFLGFKPFKGVGIGIASGPAVRMQTPLSHSNSNVTITDYVGYTLNLAAKLQARARPAGIILPRGFLDEKQFRNQVGGAKWALKKTELPEIGEVSVWATEDIQLSPPGVPVPVLAWDGYGAALEKARFTHPVHILEHKALQGDFTALKINTTQFDINIEDHDVLWYLHCHSPTIRFAQRRFSPAISALKATHNVPTFLTSAEVCRNLELVPLKFGINAFAFRNWNTFLKITNPSNLSYKMLLDIDIWKALANDSQTPIAFWDQTFIGMTCILAAAGVQLSQAYMATSEEISDATKAFCESDVAKKCIVYRDIADLGHALKDGTVKCVVGGGSWLATKWNQLARSPYNKNSGTDGIVVVVPKEGALLWVESAAIFQHSAQKIQPLSTVVEELLSSTTQQRLTQGGLYSACPVVPNLIPPDVWSRCIDARFVFRDRGYSERSTPVIVPRTTPETPDTWIEAWKKIKKSVNREA